MTCISLQEATSFMLGTKHRRPRTFWAIRLLSSASRSQISSVAGNTLRLVLPLMSYVLGIKASFTGTKQCPLWSFCHIILGAESFWPVAVFICLDEFRKAAVVDPCPPLSINLKLEGRETVGSEATASIQGKTQASLIFFQHVKENSHMCWTWFPVRAICTSKEGFLFLGVHCCSRPERSSHCIRNASWN